MTDETRRHGYRFALVEQEPVLMEGAVVYRMVKAIREKTVARWHPAEVIIAGR